MAHDIMADLTLPGLRHVVVDVVHMGLHLRNLLIRDDRPAVLAQAQLLLRLRQGDPQPPPCTELHVR